MDLLEDLLDNANLTLELHFSSSFPAVMIYEGSIEKRGKGYRFITETDGLAVDIVADPKRFNVVADGDSVTISKEAGTLGTYIRIRPRF